MGRSSKNSGRTNAANEEQMMINLAMKQAKRQLLEGTAPAQIVTHFLKLATTKEQLENEKLRKDLEVSQAKIEDIHSKQEIKELFSKAIDAMGFYSGNTFREEYEEDE